MKTIYKPVFIKSEADLPKKTGYYFMSTGEKYDRNFDVFHFTKINARQNTLDWLEHVVWYLQPVELPSDEEIKLACPQTLIARISCWIQGAKWLRDKLINK